MHAVDDLPPEPAGARRSDRFIRRQSLPGTRDQGRGGTPSADERAAAID
jgi:hypothetical protein